MFAYKQKALERASTKRKQAAARLRFAHVWYMDIHQSDLDMERS